MTSCRITAPDFSTPLYQRCVARLPRTDSESKPRKQMHAAKSRTEPCMARVTLSTESGHLGKGSDHISNSIRFEINLPLPESSHNEERTAEQSSVEGPNLAVAVFHVRPTFIFVSIA